MIFVDTTFWVGDADSNDDFHQSAHAGVDAVRKGMMPMALTTDFVINETVTILGRRRGFGAKKAARVARSLMSSPRVFVVYMDEDLFGESLGLYPLFQGKLGLTDVASVVVMKRYGVREIFSHDQDFDNLEGVKRRERPVRG